jgi:hypothetical protein
MLAFSSGIACTASHSFEMLPWLNKLTGDHVMLCAWQVLATDGDDELGGDDFTRALAAHLASASGAG